MDTKSRASHVGLSDPLESVEKSDKHSRIMMYKDDRNQTDKDTTSRLRYALFTAYYLQFLTLSAGIIAPTLPQELYQQENA